MADESKGSGSSFTLNVPAFQKAQKRGTAATKSATVALKQQEEGLRTLNQELLPGAENMANLERRTRAAKDASETLTESLKEQYLELRKNYQEFTSFAGMAKQAGSAIGAFSNKLVTSLGVQAQFERRMADIRTAQDANTQSMTNYSANMGNASKNMQRYLDDTKKSHFDAITMQNKYNISMKESEKIQADVRSKFSTQLAAYKDLNQGTKHLVESTIILSKTFGIDASQATTYMHERMQVTNKTLKEVEKESFLVAKAVDKYTESLHANGKEALKTAKLTKQQLVSAIQEANKSYQVGQFNMAAYADMIAPMAAKYEKMGHTASETLLMVQGVGKAMAGMQSSDLSDLFGIQGAQDLMDSMATDRDKMDAGTRKRYDTAIKESEGLSKLRRMEMVIEATRGSKMYTQKVFEKAASVGNQEILGRMLQQKGGMTASASQFMAKEIGAGGLAAKAYAGGVDQKKDDKEAAKWRKKLSEQTKKAQTPLDNIDKAILETNNYLKSIEQYLKYSLSAALALIALRIGIAYLRAGRGGIPGSAPSAGKAAAGSAAAGSAAVGSAAVGSAADLAGDAKAAKAAKVTKAAKAAKAAKVAKAAEGGTKAAKKAAKAAVAANAAKKAAKAAEVAKKAAEVAKAAPKAGRLARAGAAIKGVGTKAGGLASGAGAKALGAVGAAITLGMAWNAARKHKGGTVDKSQVFGESILNDTTMGLYGGAEKRLIGAQSAGMQRKLGKDRSFSRLIAEGGGSVSAAPWYLKPTAISAKAAGTALHGGMRALGSLTGGALGRTGKQQKALDDLDRRRVTRRSAISKEEATQYKNYKKLLRQAADNLDSLSEEQKKQLKAAKKFTKAYKRHMDLREEGFKKSIDLTHSRQFTDTADVASKLTKEEFAHIKDPKKRAHAVMEKIMASSGTLSRYKGGKEALKRLITGKGGKSFNSKVAAIVVKQKLHDLGVSERDALEVGPQMVEKFKQIYRMEGAAPSSDIGGRGSKKELAIWKKIKAERAAKGMTIDRLAAGREFMNRTGRAAGALNRGSSVKISSDVEAVAAAATTMGQVGNYDRSTGTMTYSVVTPLKIQVAPFAAAAADATVQHDQTDNNSPGG